MFDDERNMLVVIGVGLNIDTKSMLVYYLKNNSMRFAI
jgi:hypothetical protein